MNIAEFIKDKMVVIISNVLIFIILASILLMVNVQFIIIFLLLYLVFPLISYMAIEFIKCKNYYNEINAILENLDKKYLLPEVIEETNFIHGEKINSILREISRDMHENVKIQGYANGLQRIYRDMGA